MIASQKPSNILRTLHSIITYSVEKAMTESKISGTKPLQNDTFICRKEPY